MSNVNHPAHYNSSKIEVIQAIEAWKMDYHLGSVIKYIARAGRKSVLTEIEDLEKAAWFLARKIELLKAQRDDRDPVKPNDMVARAK